jgi:hypothetical protein
MCRTPRKRMPEVSRFLIQIAEQGLADIFGYGPDFDLVIFVIDAGGEHGATFQCIDLFR